MSARLARPRGDGVRRRHRRRRARRGSPRRSGSSRSSPDIGVVVVEKGSEVGAHILSGAVIDPIGLDRLLPEWRSEDTPIKTAVTDDRFYWLGAGGAAAAEFPDAAADEQPRQLHRLARQRVPLARHQGRSARRRNLSGLCRRRGAVSTTTARWSASPPATWASARTATPQGRLHARHGAARQIHAVRRRRARQPDQAADRALRPRRGPRAAEIRHRPEGALAGRAGKAPAGPGAAHRSAGRSTTRPAAARSSITSTTIWCRSASSFISTTPIRISRRSRNSSASRPIRWSRDTFEGGKRLVLRRARDHRRRLPVGAEACRFRAAR